MSFKNRVEENVEQDDILGISEWWFDIGIGWLTYDEDIHNVYKQQKQNILAVLSAAWAQCEPPLSATEYAASVYREKLNTAQQSEIALTKVAVELVAKELKKTFNNQQKN